MASSRLTVGLVADLLEEQWPSMDLVADMVFAHLRSGSAGDLDVTMLRPHLKPSALTRLGRTVKVDRFVRRFFDYPSWLRSQAGRFRTFHVVDHSYAHVVHALPGERTVVTCHDADAFLPLVAPQLTTSRLPLALVRRVLSGLRAARLVACPSAATRDELLQFGLVERDRIVVVPNGVHPACTPAPQPEADAFIDALLGEPPQPFDLLHVGTCIPRKRIDRLLEIVAALRAREPRVRLLKAGGTFTPEQEAQLEWLGLGNAVVRLPFVTSAQLAALYRRAAVVLAPSDREGFGLPLAEALACGTSVVASDLAVFREVGGSAARYARPDDLEGWCRAVLDAVEERQSPTRRVAAVARHVAHASQFSWQANASAMATLYHALDSGVDTPASMLTGTGA